MTLKWEKNNISDTENRPKELKIEYIQLIKSKSKSELLKYSRLDLEYMHKIVVGINTQSKFNKTDIINEMLSYISESEYIRNFMESY